MVNLKKKIRIDIQNQVTSQKYLFKWTDVF